MCQASGGHRVENTVQSASVDVDTSHWSGDGAFTQSLIESMSLIDRVQALRVEDASATRSDVEYNFISNELYVGFQMIERIEESKRFGVIPIRRTVLTKAMTIRELEASLTALQPIGAPDYSDDDMLQYLRTERIVPPYQTRGYKLVELVRVYEFGAEPRA